MVWKGHNATGSCSLGEQKSSVPGGKAVSYAIVLVIVVESKSAKV